MSLGFDLNFELLKGKGELRFWLRMDYGVNC